MPLLFPVDTLLYAPPRWPARLTSRTLVSLPLAPAGLAASPLDDRLVQFAPSFLIVALVGPWIPRLRRSPVARAFLRGVNAAVVALILAVAVALFHAAIVDVWTALILLAGLIALLRWRADTLWLVLGGAACGLAHYLWA